MSADKTHGDAGGRPNSKLEQGRVSDESITAVHQQILREKPEPKEGFSPTPIFIVFLLSALSLICGIYLSRYSGGFDPLVFDETVDVYAETASVPVEVDMIALGKRMYAQCAACHQMSGQGVPGAFPSLVGSDWVTGDEKRATRIVLFGLKGPIEVNGTTYNGVMPGFGPKSGYRFTEQQIAAVLTYVRSEWGNAAAPVSVETVEEVYASLADRNPNQAWTVEELQQAQ
jgi:mono/diheme cytochrome c family protein